MPLSKLRPNTRQEYHKHFILYMLSYHQANNIYIFSKNGTKWLRFGKKLQAVSVDKKLPETLSCPNPLKYVTSDEKKLNQPIFTEALSFASLRPIVIYFKCFLADVTRKPFIWVTLISQTPVVGLDIIYSAKYCTGTGYLYVFAGSRTT